MIDDDSSDYSRMSMLELFQVEIENHCATLTECLLELEKKPGTHTLLETLMRAAHSAKGAARIVEIDPVVQLTHAMEDVFVACQEDKLKLDRQDIDILLQGVDIMTQLTHQAEGTLADWLIAQTERLKVATACIAGIVKQIAAPESEPASLPSSAPQTRWTDGDLQSLSMFDLFRMEVETQCEILTIQLLQLEENPLSGDLLNSLMRASHSVKGAARLIKLDDAIRIAHAMEDVFTVGQTGKIRFDHRQIDALLQGVDLINAIAGTGEDRMETFLNSHCAEIETLVHDLQRIAYPDRGTGPTGAPDPTPLPPGKAHDNTGVARSTIREIKTGSRTEARETTRSIRISAENMSRLMGLAGEMLIESRWLPTFTGRLQRLKTRQDELLLMFDSLTDDLLVHSTGDTLMENRLGEFRKKMETCRNLTVENNLIVEAHARHATEISHRLYREAIASRMLPFANGIKAFPRMVRDLARELGKSVKLEIVGAKTPVDRDILEKIEAPLNHLIRNAIDHGIEPPEVRKKLGKSPEATIQLEAFHRAGMLNIIIADDGRGIDVELIRRKIVEKKLVGQEIALALANAELIEFLFLPNFSTRESVNKISGRGVGLDVVRSVIHEIRGVIYPSTQLQHGTRFELQLPQTLSVMRALVVEVGREPYALPLVAIDHIIRVAKHELQEVRDRQYVMYNDKRVGLMAAEQILQVVGGADEDEVNVVIVSNRMNHYGLMVNRLWGIRDLIIQPLHASLSKIKDISSASILEDGTPVLILDIEDILHSMDILVNDSMTGSLEKSGRSQEEKVRKRILVADDSITVREVERKILSAKGYQVDIAIDGVDAWNTLQENTYDLIVTDIDMPRMDGIELAHMVKNDPKYEWLPIIIVSYKDRKEDRRRGLEAGADYYLTKSSFQNESFVNAVRDLIGDAE
jgi:two-component system sensor histidine kinase and response regulator WspE